MDPQNRRLNTATWYQFCQEEKRNSQGTKMKRTAVIDFWGVLMGVKQVGCN
jgi:hypothetical protein